MNGINEKSENRKMMYLYWYKVVWVNTDYKGKDSEKVGTVFGVEERYEDNKRVIFDAKKKDFVTASKYRFLFRIPIVYTYEQVTKRLEKMKIVTVKKGEIKK